MSGANILARTKATPPPEPDPEPTHVERVAVIHLKGTPEFAAWLEDAYQASHIPKASLVRLGLAAWAKEYGFRPPPKR